jgi:hypothetical protein
VAIYHQTAVIYCHSFIITNLIEIYNTELWYYLGIEVNSSGKKFYRIGNVFLILLVGIIEFPKKG